jgi:hypothetical protein
MDKFKIERGIYFRLDGIVYRVAYVLGKHFGADTWHYSKWLNAWVYTASTNANFISSAFETYQQNGRLEVLTELPEEITK